jgi:Ricin-type beta-trefoil lectin domain
MRIGKRTGLMATTAAALMSLMLLTTPAGASPTANQPTGLDVSTAQSATTLGTGLYFFKNSSGKCLEIDNSSLGDGAKAQQWECKGQAGMFWRIYDNGIFGYLIVNYNSGRCLEIDNSSWSNGAKAQQWECKGQTGANWQLQFNGYDLHVINSSGKCLEIDNSSWSDGAKAQQWECKGQSGALWYLYELV